MFEAVDGLVNEHAEIEQRLADPGIHSDQGLAKRLNQRYAELSAIVRTYHEWRRLTDDPQHVSIGGIGARDFPQARAWVFARDDHLVERLCGFGRRLRLRPHGRECQAQRE